MINPCESPTAGDFELDGWKFSFDEAWYARVVLFFKAELKRKNGKPNALVRLAYVQWYHRYDVDSGEEHISCASYVIHKLIMLL